MGYEPSTPLIFFPFFGSRWSKLGVDHDDQRWNDPPELPIRSDLVHGPLLYYSGEQDDAWQMMHLQTLDLLILLGLNLWSISLFRRSPCPRSHTTYTRLLSFTSSSTVVLDLDEL